MSLPCDALPVRLTVPLEDGRRKSEGPNKSKSERRSFHRTTTTTAAEEEEEGG